MATDIGAPIPPGGPLEVVFSFDTTRSMYSWLDELRGRIQDMIQRLQADIPGIKIAVMAHGDYCDADTYVTKWIDFTSDVAKLCDFVKNVERTGGGDAPECYELVLKQVADDLSWTPGARRVLIMIGDNRPHEPHDACNKDKIDWKKETEKLAHAGVVIYGIQCGHFSNANRFYKTISMATMGKHLRLAEFNSLFDTLMAVCYREGNDTAMLASYEKEVRDRCGEAGIAMDIDAIFTSLRDGDRDGSASSTSSGPTLTTAAPFMPRSSPAIPKNPAKATAKVLVKAVAKTSPKSTVGARKLQSVKRPAPNTHLKKFRQRNLPLLKRENVPENNFSLRSMKWTSWTMVIANSSDIPSGESGLGLWETRKGRVGYRLKKLTTSKSTKVSLGQRALFEVAVQGHGANKRRHIVFSTFSARCLGVKRWERRLLGVARSQVDRVLSAGCKVYVRYCLVGAQADVVSTRKDIQRYDYAWRRLRNVRASARDVTKGNLKISKSAA